MNSFAQNSIQKLHHLFEEVQLDISQTLHKNIPVVISPFD